MSNPVSGREAVAILDFGSQYSQIIARRVREAQVYCELFRYDAPAEEVLALKPRGFILSGGPSSVYEHGRAAACRRMCWRAGCRCWGSATGCSSWRTIWEDGWRQLAGGSMGRRCWR